MILWNKKIVFINELYYYELYLMIKSSQLSWSSVVSMSMVDEFDESISMDVVPLMEVVELLELDSEQLLSLLVLHDKSASIVYPDLLMLL